MSEQIQINVAQAESTINMLNQHSAYLDAAYQQIQDLIMNGMDHWQGEAKERFITEYMEIGPKLRVSADFVRDQARVIREVKEAFQGIRIG